ncbi:MAG TPA: flagellar basal-body MS-ring/collar protein FliF [Terracidiphilus sp.]|nr:flagellar basal-body MS-ring/collar protein FliF [Terracidiphilus sp.]
MNIVEQAKQFWTSRTGRQKAFLVGGAGATVVLLTLFARLIGTPDYKPLYKDLEPADAQALAAQLTAQNIPNQIGPDGKTVNVSADKIDAARMQTAQQGQPHSGRMGFELFDKMTWGQTEFDEKVAYQRALEGELERTIQTLGNIDRARVHLVMPSDSVFIDRQRGAKASVILKMKRGGLSKDSALAISRLVAGAVDELKPEDVSIIDADTEMSLGPGHSELGGSNEDEEARLTQRLITTLEPVVGANAIRASVNIDYDHGSVEQSEEKYDPAVSAVLSSQKSEDEASGAGAVPMGVPGTASNVPTASKTKPAAGNTASAQQGTSQSSKSENTQYGVNKTVIHTVLPGGRVQRVTAALLVDDTLVKNVQKGKTTYTRQKRSPDELNKIRELAQAAIGFDAKRGDTLSVQNMAFSADATDADLPATGWTTQVQKAVTDYSPALRPLALLVMFVMAYLFVIRPVQKMVLAPAQLGAGGAGGQQALAAAGAAPVQPLSVSAMPAELGTGNMRAAQLKTQTFELVRQKPVDTARAMQAWLREENS